VALIGALSRNWNAHFAVELELLRDDLEGSTSDGAAENLLNDIVRNFSNGIGDNEVWAEVALLSLLFLIPSPPLAKHLFLRQRKVFLRNRFVVTERRKPDGEKLPPLACFLHVFNMLRHEPLILLLRILFVEDAILVIFERYTTKTIVRPVTVETVEHVRTVRSAGKAESNIVDIEPDSPTQVDALNILAEGGNISAGFGFVQSIGVRDVFGFTYIKRIAAAMDVGEVVARRLVRVGGVLRFLRELQRKFTKLLPTLFNNIPKTQIGKRTLKLFA
jgi:hypothetical protein